MNNILQVVEYSRLCKTFSNGLSKYVQSNCQCTLTDSGYRIYRPANVTYSSSDSSTRTMWGGLIINPFTADSNAMIKGSNYCLMFDVSGKSSNNNEFYWSNNAGGGGGSYGLGTTVTTIAANMQTGSDFSGTKQCYYAFTPGDIMKTCTTSYSSFVKDKAYNVFRDFKWGYGYTSTGTMGTDIYITNIRLYNITNIPTQKILKNGILDTGAIVAYCDSNTLSMQKYGETRMNDIIEY